MIFQTIMVTIIIITYINNTLKINMIIMFNVEFEYQPLTFNYKEINASYYQCWVIEGKSEQSQPSHITVKGFSHYSHGPSHITVTAPLPYTHI